MSAAHSPTRPLSEDDVIGMFLRALHEFHTGVVLPVTHGLLEQRPVVTCKAMAINGHQWTPAVTWPLALTAEIGLNLIRNHSVVPEALSPGGGRSSGAFEGCHTQRVGAG